MMCPRKQTTASPGLRASCASESDTGFRSPIVIRATAASTNLQSMHALFRSPAVRSSYHRAAAPCATASNTFGLAPRIRPCWSPQSASGSAKSERRLEERIQQEEGRGRPLEEHRTGTHCFEGACRGDMESATNAKLPMGACPSRSWTDFGAEKGDWRARRDSNPRPTASEAVTLSS